MPQEDNIFGADLNGLKRLLTLGSQEEADPAEDCDQDATASMHDLPEQIGLRIGRYKLLSVLGEGGMGIVYLAQQERPIRRQVALKIIKPGMDSKSVIARFEAERQALALLDHPHIAHVHDAGATEAGRPYFVMEYVQGVPITEHCDRYKLTVGERLELFLRVCEAIQHAHQKGIIHRDIKPSNVQIAIQDQQAVPKVIDFGVAKAVSQPLTDRTLVTEQGQFIGTPEYMSPEQADMTGQDVDTRSDIYGLGVLLYELLTGILPFDSQTLREGGVDRIRNIIREQEPRTPSTRLSTVSGEESTKLAQLRRTDIRTLGKLLHGDLDWITLKALEKDRMRRYQTAHALAEDIQRHLNNEPVSAGAPSKIYRLKKCLRRHRAQVIGAAMVMVLGAAIVATSIMYTQFARANKKAQVLKEKDVLSVAQGYRAKGQYEDALQELASILGSEHVGAQARLLHAQVTLELEGPAAAIGPLEALTQERDEIAWQAHFLLARIYLETEPDAPNALATYRQKAGEHQQKGTALFSESPEAYFNRSMMTGTVSETLACLNKALDHDPTHYDSLEARTLIHYAMKRFEDMALDASTMIGKDPGNARGYALRAIARRENTIQKHDEEGFIQAIQDHTRAIELARSNIELAEFHDQRRQTYLQMADYEHVLSDAQACLQLQPAEEIYHFHRFSALVALGQYPQAENIYNEVFADFSFKPRFMNLCRKYVFDMRQAGQSWHAPLSRPTGAAFLWMIEADEDYSQLKAKGARRLASEGYWPTWSPDGTELVYSRGIIGYSGIEIVNVETCKTRLLTFPGCDPAWSPDGRYIAFIRERQVLLLADLTARHNEWGEVLRPQREIWLIRADGTEEPRFLAKGDFPGWSQDSQHVTFYRFDARGLYSISIAQGAKPESITECPNLCAVMSPDGRYVAYKSVYSTCIRIEDLNTGSLSAAGTGLPGLLFLNWSPTGRQISAGDSIGSSQGLWVYDLDQGGSSQILSGSVAQGRWSPGSGDQMVFTLWSSDLEMWVADTASLEPGRTLEEHCTEKIRRLSRRVKMDPDDPLHLRHRAAYYVYLEDRQKAYKDLKLFTEMVGDFALAAETYDGIAWPFVNTAQDMVDPEIALELYHRAHRLQPQDWQYLCGLGAAYYRMGFWNEAVTELTKSVELTNGKNGSNYIFLALAHWQLGNRTRALHWYDQAEDWIENSGAGWLNKQGQKIYDVFLEAEELLNH